MSEQQSGADPLPHPGRLANEQAERSCEGPVLSVWRHVGVVVNFVGARVDVPPQPSNITLPEAVAPGHP